MMTSLCLFNNTCDSVVRVILYFFFFLITQTKTQLFAHRYAFAHLRFGQQALDTVVMKILSYMLDWPDS